MARTLLVVQNVGVEGPGTLGQIWTASGLDLYTVHPYAQEQIPDPLAFDGLVVLGGPANVYQDREYPWLPRVGEVICLALAADKPILGICLGGQLLAKALGAPVSKNPQREIGFSKVRLGEGAAKDPLFAGFPSQFCVFQWHADTFTLPEGGLLVAEGDVCQNQVFRYGEMAWGLQFHLEVTPAMIQAWLAAYPGEVSPQRAIALAKEAGRAESLLPLATRLGHNFARLVFTS